MPHKAVISKKCFPGHHHLTVLMYLNISTEAFHIEIRCGSRWPADGAVPLQTGIHASLGSSTARLRYSVCLLYKCQFLLCLQKETTSIPLLNVWGCWCAHQMFFSSEQDMKQWTTEISERWMLHKK